jgi:DNA invertase Pin-like site-specific DNA recombinase
MTDLPPDIQARRNIEDRAATLGAKRRALDSELTKNTQAIIQLLRDAEGTGVTYDYLAHLTGVSRQTLYRWREIASHLQPGETVAQMLSKQTQEGHFLRYKG